MATQILRCPSCRPAFGKVMWPDGRRFPFQPVADYVGYLKTQRYKGQLRPPRLCPNCGSPLRRD